jgi:GDP-4-dehydro-6-deoxy-D-mannose reductase
MVSSNLTMRVLVTGAAGFVGGHVRRALVESGHEVFTELDASAASRDLTIEGVAATLVRVARPDAVVHLAARVEPRSDVWHNVVRNNPLAAFRLLEAVRQRAPRARVIVASSSAIYGPVPIERNPVRETEPARPATMYGASKVATEAIASAFAASGLRVVVCRPFNTIGPGGDKRSALAQWTRKLLELDHPGSDGVFRCGPLNTSRDLTDVRDIARAYVEIVEQTVTEPVLNLCSGRAVEGAFLLDMLFSAAGVRPPVVSSLPSAGDILCQRGDRSRLAALTGWEPSITLQQTVEDVLREQRQSALSSPIDIGP